MIKQSRYSLPILLFLSFPNLTFPQELEPPGDPIVIQIIELEYADAEQLAQTLEPLLSPQGRIVAYGPSNSLIIKDRKSMVEALVKVIKGKSDH
jgi:type II secretory pathway component GspD/PulD (secretin)